MRTSTFRMVGATAAVLAATVSLTACKKAASPAAPPVAAGPTADAPGCDVARAYVTSRLGRFADKAMVVVDSAAPNTTFVPLLKAADITRKYDPGQENPAGWPKDPPSAALVTAWQAAAQTSPFGSCVDFAKVVADAGVSMGKVDIKEKANKDGAYRTQVNFTMPVVSADGAEALILEEGRSGPGLIELAVHLRKDKTGAWTEADALAVLTNAGS